MDEVERIKRDGLVAARDLLEPVVLAKRRAEFQAGLSLQSLAAKAIIEFPGWRSHGSQEGNPFKMLPKSLAGQLLVRFLAENASAVELQPWQHRLVEMLLRACRVTKLNLASWQKSRDLYDLEYLVARHCPELKELSLKFTGARWVQLMMLNPAICGLRELHVVHMKNITITPYQLQFMGTNMGKLRVLQFSILDSAFEQLGEAQLSRLSQLRELTVEHHPEIEVERHSGARSIKRALKMVEVVQQLPGLELLACTSLYWDAFVRRFGQRCRERRLIIERIYLEHLVCDFDFWPSSLKVKKLILEGPFSGEKVNLLCTIPAESLQSLSLIALEYQHHFLKTLDALAANVSHLELSACDWEVEFAKLDLHQLLLAAPQVVSFSLDVDFSVYHGMRHPQMQIKSSYFQKWTRFMAECSDWGQDFDDQNCTGPLSKMFRLYLLGAEKLDELDIRMPGLLRVALVTLSENKKIGIGTRRLSVLIFDNQDRPEMLRMALDLASLLILRSPCFEGVMLHGTGIETMPHTNNQWFRDLAAAANVKFITQRKHFGSGSPWKDNN